MKKLEGLQHPQFFIEIVSLNLGEHFTGLALLNIHKNIPINIDNIISKFGKIKQRRLNFVT
jgi:hypothetical protein